MSAPKGKKGTHNRLFCVGDGETFRYVMSPTKVEAAKKLGSIKEVRSADSDDVRRLWEQERLYELTVEQLEERFGVSRQAIDMWKKKGGIDLKSRADHLRDQARERILEAFDPTKSAQQIALEAKSSSYRVREIANEKGVTLPNNSRKRPSDEEIIRLAEGRNWRELAAECGITLHTLRHYIYSRPELAEKVCPLLISQKMGGNSHGKVVVDEMIVLHEQGWTAYQLSVKYQVEVVTILYWLRKLNLIPPAPSQRDD